MLAVTITLFPFLFLTLELPKRIINDAIGAQSEQISLLGFELSREAYLWLLCAAFLIAVVLHGLLKMRINTMKGVLSERMLRRLRYSLIARMLRFPKPYFQRTSQGELVAMINGETEPMGGLIGDALTQPVMQAGQMATILFFLFLQSVWFGLAAVALIPLQAWLIPRLQRQINQMNKERIKEIRTLAGIIGETAVGASDLRMHGGWRHRLATITELLGVVYRIRFQIYQKKFFMKFINNFITQLTPFFFFSIGGYLVLAGQVSLGALVAALAAYKDLSSPWKELLAYYNQTQDMSLRWETVMERFSPPGVISEELMAPPTDERAKTRLNGDITFDSVTVADGDGNVVLENISLDIPAGALVGIAAPSEEDRRALADLLTREVVPLSGRIEIAGRDLNGLHQSVIAECIGHANSRPMLFQGSFGENAMMPISSAPVGATREEHRAALAEAIAAGNSEDPPGNEWLDPARAKVADDTALRLWWAELIDAIGSGGPMFRKALDQVASSGLPLEFRQGLVDIRPRVWEAVEAAGLDRFVHRFDPRHYCPGLPVTSNLLFATPRAPSKQADPMLDDNLLGLLRGLDLEADLLVVSRDVIELLTRIFGGDGTEHPLFRKLGLEPALFDKAQQILGRVGGRPLEALSDADKAVLMALPAQISADQIGPAFSASIQDRVVALRCEHHLQLQDALQESYAPLAHDRLAEGLSVLENALFGKVSENAGSRADDLRAVVSDVLQQQGLKQDVIGLMYDLPLSLNGGNLPALFAEPLSLIRATIKRPDILVMDQVLSSYDLEQRTRAHKNIRRLLPDATLIYISESFETPDRFDVYAEITQGRMKTTVETTDASSEDSAATADLLLKVRALEATDMFSGLDRRQLRLLAFGAKWFQAQAGDIIFNKNDAPLDGAYMLLSGSAELINPDAAGRELVATVGPGTLIGELALIRNVPRALTMRAATDIEALRLGAEEFLAVVENDAATAFKLLQVVAGYTS